MSSPYFHIFSAVPAWGGLFCAQNATLRSGKVLYFATLLSAANPCTATLYGPFAATKCALIPGAALDTVTEPDKMARKESVLHDFPTGKLAYPMGNHAKPEAASTPKEAAAVAMMHTPDEICTMATAYKAKVQDGKIKRADWAHFCGLCGECLEDMQRAISGETSEQIDGKAWAAEGDRQRVVHALKVLSTCLLYTSDAADE